MGAQRSPLMLLVMRQEFCLVSRDIDVGGAFGLASLAGETQIQRFLDVLVLPAVTQYFALQQLKQHMRAASRAVLFFTRGHVARAHGAAIIFSTGSDPDASQCGFRERTVIFGELKMRLGLAWMVVRAKAQVFCRQIRIHHLMRVELVFGIPGALEFPECLHKLRTKHPWKQSSARLPVA